MAGQTMVRMRSDESRTWRNNSALLLMLPLLVMKIIWTNNEQEGSVGVGRMRHICGRRDTLHVTRSSVISTACVRSNMYAADSLRCS